MIEDTARRIFLLAANTFKCQDNGIEFADDNAEHVTLVFDQIALIEIGNNSIEVAAIAWEGRG